MRPIHLVNVDKTRPAVILTRERARGHLTKVTVAPLTSTVRGLATEVLIGTAQSRDDSGPTTSHEGTVPAD